ncbi:MAG: transcriptional regulator [Desulfuromonadaceae bacterium GWB2_53_15]|nr:MAG: transcriptional regulator [Desulfuromonadales bacterium GWD2_54_10]OHB25359.1 MAG: transcriptional regulator [Desulfuromonadaceae bacterium GWB2_53_15]
MKQIPKKPAVPRTAQETIRHAIIDLLHEQTFSAMEISAEVRIPERDVCDHLEHIRQTIHVSGAVLQVTPAECRKCGFVFTKRDRLSSPSKCPVCRNEAILEPLFKIRQMSHC